jgi:CHAT domain-containing protein/tetratricopeptide (TPR) repeat protein
MALEATRTRLFQAAVAALGRGDYADARDDFSEYLRGRLADVGGTGEFAAWDAIAIESLAELSSHLGGVAAAEDLLEALADLCRRVGNSIVERLTTLRLARLRLRRGALRGSFDTLARMEDWTGPIDELDLTPGGLRRWEAGLQWSAGTAGDRSAVLALWYLVLGRICAANGRYREAMAAYGQGLEHARAPEARANEPGLHLGRAQALLESGELRDVLGALERVPEHPGPLVVARLEITAKALLLSGRLGEARKAYQSAIDRATAMDLPLATAALEMSLAGVLVLVNQTEAAMELTRAASERSVAAGSEELQQRARALEEFARQRRASPEGEAGVAPSVLELQLEAVGETPSGELPSPGGRTVPSLEFPPQESYLGTLEDRLVQFQHALAQGGASGARRYFDLVEFFAGTDSKLIEGRLRVARGLLCYFEGGKLDEARTCFAQAERVFADLQLVVDLRQLKRYQMWCAVRAGDRHGEEECRRQESALLERLAASLEPTDQGVFWLNKWTEDEEVLAKDVERIAALWRQSLRGGALTRLVGRARVLWNLGRFLHSLDEYRGRRMRQALDLPLSGENPRSRWWTRLLRYPRNRATVSLLVLPDRVFSCCIWRFGADFRVRPVTRIEVRRLVRRFHAAVVGHGDEHAIDALRALVGALGLDTLFSRLPERVKALGFIPDDALLGVPFAALPLGDKHLLDRWAVSMSHAWHSTANDRGVSSALLVAEPDPGGGFPVLERALAEVDAVERAVCAPGTSVKRLRPPEATRRAVLEALPGASLWHVACHGEFNPRAPAASGIALRGPSREEPERLTLRDLGQLDLRGIRLAFLASCCSADNFITPGRWVLSLPHALHGAGAQTIVGSLWETVDAISERFTGEFYRLLRGGESCDEAFRRAQLSCRQGAQAMARPLWDWAGFVLAGDVAPLEWRSP